MEAYDPRITYKQIQAIIRNAVKFLTPVRPNQTPPKNTPSPMGKTWQLGAGHSNAEVT